MKELVIGSRGSQLALWQAHWARDVLQGRLRDTRVGIRVIRTQGDADVSVSFDQLPGKGFFVKEIEEALIAEEIDLAVHSMKDVPSELPEGLFLAAITAREDPRDVLVTQDGLDLEGLPRSARVGTGSPRRAGQLRFARPDLQIEALRGNVDPAATSAAVVRLGGTSAVEAEIPSDAAETPQTTEPAPSESVAPPESAAPPEDPTLRRQDASPGR